MAIPTSRVPPGSSGPPTLERYPSDRSVEVPVSGFRIACTPNRDGLRIEAWGYWTSETALAFVRDVATALRTVWVPLDFMFDATALKPQGTDGQSALRSLMKSLAPLQFSRAMIVCDNVLTKMQLTRLAKECGVDALLEFGDRPDSIWPRTSRPPQGGFQHGTG